MKRIFKIVTFVFALSMVAGVGMVEKAYAGILICRYCNEFSINTGSPQDDYEELLKHEKTCSLNPDNIKNSTDIALQNSVEAVNYDSLTKTEGTYYFDDEDTNVWANGQIVERVDVTVQRESVFTITIPKDIVLDGENAEALYEVTVEGDIAGDQKITVQPDTDFELVEAGGKANVPATVEQDVVEFVYSDITTAKTVDGKVSAPTLSAGTWEGKFMFNIKFE